MSLAELSLRRIEQNLPVFAGDSLPARLSAGREAAEAVLRKYVPDFAFDPAEAAAVSRRVDAWAARNERDLSDAIGQTAGDLPAALQLAMGSSTEVGQFIVASFTLAAAGLGPWSSGAVARSVSEGAHARGWAELDAEARLQCFGLIVAMEQRGELAQIFHPTEAPAGFGAWPVLLIIVATVILAAAVVTYLYLNRRLELNNRLMRELCVEAQARGDYATVEACIAATRDLQVNMFEEAGGKVVTVALVLGGIYLALTFVPKLLWRGREARA